MTKMIQTSVWASFSRKLHFSCKWLSFWDYIGYKCEKFASATLKRIKEGLRKCTFNTFSAVKAAQELQLFVHLSLNKWPSILSFYWSMKAGLLRRKMRFKVKIFSFGWLMCLCIINKQSTRNLKVSALRNLTQDITILVELSLIKLAHLVHKSWKLSQTKTRIITKTHYNKTRIIECLGAVKPI